MADRGRARVVSTVAVGVIDIQRVFKKHDLQNFDGRNGVAVVDTLASLLGCTGVSRDKFDRTTGSLWNSLEMNMFGTRFKAFKKAKFAQAMEKIADLAAFAEPPSVSTVAIEKNTVQGVFDKWHVQYSRAVDELATLLGQTGATLDEFNWTTWDLEVRYALSGGPPDVFRTQFSMAVGELCKLAEFVEMEM